MGISFNLKTFKIVFSCLPHHVNENSYFPDRKYNAPEFTLFKNIKLIHQQVHHHLQKNRFLIRLVGGRIDYSYV